MATYNVFLTGPVAAKGGGLFLERPEGADNIVSQTAASEPDAFESRLADEMMAVFAAGIWDLGPLIDELNRRGGVDREGRAWTVASFQAQLERSASLLFATVP